MHSLKSLLHCNVRTALYRESMKRNFRVGQWIDYKIRKYAG